jgi:hypothetical protein
MTDNSGSAKEE